MLAVVLAVLGSVQASASLPWLGQPVTAWTPSDLPVFPTSAAVSPAGTVLYVLANNGLIYEYSTTTGKYIGGFGGFGHGAGEFFQPKALTVDPYANIWVADTGNGRVVKLSPSGKQLLSIAMPQPIGVAAGTAEVYALSGLLRAVAERSWAGKDVGGYIATFPSGFSFASNYGSPTNSAVAIAADNAGHSAVVGTVSQRLEDGDRSSCKSPLSTLDPLPDPLVAPAETVFDDHGNALRESYPLDAGAICWTDNPVRWSYGLTGRQGLGIAVDPVSGEMYATTSEGSGPVDGDPVAGPQRPGERHAGAGAGGRHRDGDLHAERPADADQDGDDRRVGSVRRAVRATRPSRLVGLGSLGRRRGAQRRDRAVLHAALRLRLAGEADRRGRAGPAVTHAHRNAFSNMCRKPPAGVKRPRCAAAEHAEAARCPRQAESRRGRGRRA